MLEVCCGLILSKCRQKVLVTKRKDTLKYEFPGGKVKLGESFQECIEREISEELSVHIVCEKRLQDVLVMEINRIIRLIPFLCTSIDIEQLALKDHSDVLWLSIQSDASQIEWQSKNYEIFKNLKAFLEQ